MAGPGSTSLGSMSGNFHGQQLSGGQLPDQPAKLGIWQRVLIVLPRLRSEGRPSLEARARRALLKPADPATMANFSNRPPSVEKLREAARAADDKERNIGVFAAPLAGLIALVVISALLAGDPSPHLRGGALNPSHVSTTLYYELLAVLLGLAVVMLVTAMLRKRLYLGIVMALYGLAIFNLHYWGFGLPFILGGAWLLVRSYRVQRDLREATDGISGSERRRGSSGSARGPQWSKRYTPPITARRR